MLKKISLFDNADHMGFEPRISSSMFLTPLPSKWLFLKMGHSLPLSLYFRLFNTVDNKQMFYIKVCWWLDSNSRLLVSEGTTLPTEPQPLPYPNGFYWAHQYSRTLTPAKRSRQCYTYLCSSPTKYFVLQVFPNCFIFSHNFRCLSKIQFSSSLSLLIEANILIIKLNR